MSLSDDTYLLSGQQQKIGPEFGKWISTFAARLRHIGTAWSESRKRDQEMRDLHRFSDRELWDVGLSRSDVWSIERGTYRKD
jgi:uncharacterized protein YjiS (DUF1127 family)